MKKRIRVGNDFDITWSIKRGGAVEDFTTAVDKKLTMVVYGKTIDNPNFTITGGTLGINVPKELVTTLGDYRLIFEYTLPDAGQPDGDLKCQTDVIPFRIVATTAEADVIATIDVTSDVAIGLRGDKGLQGDDAYQVWLDAGNVGTLDDYFAWQRQPATDAGNMVVDQTVLFLNEQAAALEDRADLFFEGVQTGTIAPIEQAETERVAAETARANAEGDATKGRVKAENERVIAEGERVAAETARANAEGDATKGRVKAENDRVVAEGERAQAFTQMMGEADDKIEEMDTTLSTYDGRVTQVESDISQLAGEVSLLDAVQGSKIREIENVLSTANLGQSTQVSVSGRKVVSLPKNAANGGMQVKLEGLTAENLVVDGKLITATSYSHSTGQRIDVILGNKYYARRLYQTISGTDGSATGRVVTLSPIHEFVSASNILSRISTYNSASESEKSIYAYGPQSGTILGEFRDVMIINLTATFGAGNEPDLATCDAMFSDYLEGVKSFVPTGRVRSVDKLGENPTTLYLTAPELRSNGTVKDEVRKGSNGYELVKRVGVGTSNGEIVINGDFGTADNWTVAGGTSIISDGTLKIVADAGIGANATQNKTITAGKIYRYSINVLGITGAVYLQIGGNSVKTITAASGIGVYTGFFIPSANGTLIRMIKDVGTATNAEIDTLSIIEYNPAEGVAMAGGEAVFGSNVHYTLANPVISPISYGGILNSAENGTIYHEPIIADAGVYGTDIPIFNTDYPIASLEEIIKHENGVDTYLNASTAVIAPDGLSFTHPDLTEGDLVLFTYSFDKESTNGQLTATFYDSNVVKIDTVTGKAYKITDVVTNGVLTRTLTEV